MLRLLYVGNGIEAARKRHFKIDSGVGKASEKGLASLNYASAKVLNFLQQDACDTGKIQDVFDHMVVRPEIMQSSKWSKERFLKGLRNVGIAFGPELPKRKFAVKPNEALGKKKPRGIISAGDEGVIVHLFDAAVFERLLFQNPLFESRSIKHASTHDYAMRLGNFMRSYDWTASADFGAFDGSCTHPVRDIVENAVLGQLLMRVLGDQEAVTDLVRGALRDRVKDSCKMRLGAFVRMHIKNMIRESGDRGTSILNFLTNFVMFVATAHMMLIDAGFKRQAADAIIENAIRTGELFNIKREGDDGAMGFAQKYIDGRDGRFPEELNCLMKQM